MLDYLINYFRYHNYFSQILILLWTILIGITISYGFFPFLSIRKYRLPHPITMPYFGTQLWVYLYGPQLCFAEWGKKFGHIYVIAEGSSLSLVVSEPSLLRQILVSRFSTFPNRRRFPLGRQFLGKSVFTTLDDEWRHARRAIMPTFTSARIKSNIYPIVLACAAKIVKELRNEIDVNESNSNTINHENKGKKCITIDVKKVMGRFSMRSISSVAFGIDIDSHMTENFIKQANKIFELEITSPIYILATLFPFMALLLRYIPLPMTNISTFDYFANVVEKSIDQRLQNKIKRKDYLQILLEAHEVYEESRFENIQKQTKIKEAYNVGNNDLIMKDFKSNGITTHKKGSYGQNKESGDGLIGLSKQEIISNSILFFIAGYDSTSTALSWIIHTLAWHPEIQERMRQEIYKVLDKDNNSGREITIEYSQILELNYMECVIKEVLRLHPPAIFVDRIASEDCQLTVERNDNCYPNILQIKKDTVIQIPICQVHRNPEIWINPDHFIPERSQSAEKNRDAQYNFMPFGQGPRNCLGMRFAMLEIKTILALMFCSGLRFRPCDGDFYPRTPENTRFNKNISNYPRPGLQVICEIID